MSISVLLAAGHETWESQVVRRLQQMPGLVLARRCVDVADAVATTASGQARIALVSLDLPGLDGDAVHRMIEAGAHPVGLVDHIEPQHTTRATALGLRGTLAIDEIDELRHLVARIEESASERGTAAHGFEGADPARGRLIAVWGPTGGPGRSTVALGVASETASLGVPTLLIDADVYGGSIAQMLAMLDEVSGVLAAARSANAGALDLAELERHVRELSPTLRVLTGLPRADRWPGLRPGSFSAVLELARQMASVVVVDLGFNLETEEDVTFDTAAPRRNGATVTALEQADDVVVVGSADPLGLTRLTRSVYDLRDVVPGATTHVVVNKVRGSLGWSRDQIAQTVHRFIGISPAIQLPLDQSAVDRAWLSGRTLAECAKDSPLRASLTQLARQLTVQDFVGIHAATSTGRRRLPGLARARGRTTPGGAG